ncbi:CAP domain-containing protein [Actinoplanes sp. NPDC051859]|uniref:CAP domain-containing protein n=1 Tax=Actinoplanes sp. NPDC051859 TaxID=3363909 RepID=UPI0037945D85
MSAAQQFRYTLAAGATAVVIGVGFTVAGFGADETGTDARRTAADAPLTTQPPALPDAGTSDTTGSTGTSGNLLPQDPEASASPSKAAATTSAPKPKVTTTAPPAIKKATDAKPTPTKRRTTAPTERPAENAPDTSGSVLDQALAHINAERRAEGVGPLSIDTQLSKAAALHTQLMINGCKLNHRCSGESGLGDRFSAQGVRWSSAGENIAFRTAGSSDAEMVKAANRMTDDMLAEVPPEDGHRRNLLSENFTRIGLSVVRDNSGIVWLTQDFVG